MNDQDELQLHQFWLNLQNFYQHHGTKLWLALILASVLFVGGRWWYTQQQVNLAEASEIYYNLLVALETSQQQENLARTAQYLEQQLLDHYPNTPYAAVASLIEAKRAIADDDLTRAAVIFRQILANKVFKSEALVAIIRLRLARVMAAQGDLDGAMDLLKKKPPAEIVPIYDETQGDFLLMAKQQEQAIVEYQKAFEALKEQGFPADATKLVLKLQALNALPTQGTLESGHKLSETK